MSDCGLGLVGLYMACPRLLRSTFPNEPRQYHAVPCSLNCYDEEMLYIGPWLEYTIAKQLREQEESSHSEAHRLPSVERSASSKQKRPTLDPLSLPKKKTLPSIASHRPTKCTEARSEHTGSSGSIHAYAPKVLPAHTQHRRDFYGETRSLRRFQNELASLGSPTSRKAISRTSTGKSSSSRNSSSSPTQRATAGTKNRLAQIQRMQNIYRQGKERAQAHAKERQHRDKIILPSDYRNIEAPQRKTLSRQIRPSIPANDDSNDDKLLAWVGGLDLDGI